jgi:hypothetical protein
VVMNFASPSPAYGRYRQRVIPASLRLQCDLVLALGSLDGLVHEHHLGLEQVLDRLSAFSRRWLLTEFAPREDQGWRTRWPGASSRWTLENLAKALRRRFHTIRAYSSHPNEPLLLLCEK